MTYKLLETNQIHMTKRNLLSAIILMLALLAGAFAQRPENISKFNGKISGNVYDAEYREPISYANIVLYRQEDNTQVTGTITNERTGETYQSSPYPPFVLDIINAGGLVSYTRTMLGIEISG